MAGEQTKTARLTLVQDSGITSDSRLNGGKLRAAIETEAITTGELEAADNIIYDIDMPSNAIVTDRKSTRLNSSHSQQSRMPSSA